MTTQSIAPEFKVVGSSCLVDFLGHSNPEQVVRLFEYLSDAISSCSEEEGGFGGGGTDRFGVGSFLGYVAAAIRADGWLSRTAARKAAEGGGTAQATADTAWGVMEKVSMGKKDQVKPVYLPTPADVTRAEAALTYIREFIEAEEAKGVLSDYLYNLSIALKIGTINFRLAGIVASVIATAEREQGKELERRKFSNLKNTSKHLGTVGEKITFQGTIAMVRETEGTFGVTTLVKFVTTEGCSLTWFASGTLPEEWKLGNEAWFIGTIKKHDEYQGVKGTMVNRVTMHTKEQVEELAAKAAKKAARAAKKAAPVNPQ